MGGQGHVGQQELCVVVVLAGALQELEELVHLHGVDAGQLVPVAQRGRPSTGAVAVAAAAAAAGELGLLSQLQRARQGLVGGQLHPVPGRLGQLQVSEAAQTAAALIPLLLLYGQDRRWGQVGSRGQRRSAGAGAGAGGGRGEGGHRQARGRRGPGGDRVGVHDRPARVCGCGTGGSGSGRPVGGREGGERARMEESVEGLFVVLVEDLRHGSLALVLDVRGEAVEELEVQTFQQIHIDGRPPCQTYLQVYFIWNRLK